MSNGAQSGEDCSIPPEIPRVAIIVVAFNSMDSIGELLDSLREDEPKGYRRSIIVVDNGSDDGSADFVEKNFPEATVARNARNLGFGAGNNIGARIAVENGAQFLAFLNDDATVTPGWLIPLLTALYRDAGLACVQPRVMLRDKPDIINTLGNRVHFLGFGFLEGFLRPFTGEPAGVRAIPYASGCACLFRAADFFSVGGFDEGFFLYHEDLDLCWRLRLQGRQIAATTESAVFHRYSFEEKDYKFYYLEKNRWAILFSLFETRTLLLIMPAFLATELGLWLYFAGKGITKHKWRAMRDFFRAENLAWVLRRRRHILKTRRTSDARLKEYLDGAMEFEGIDSWTFRHIFNPMMSMYWKIVRAFIK